MGPKVAQIANGPRDDGNKQLELLHFFDWHGSCSDKNRNFVKRSSNMEAHETQTALPLRAHTILGVCEAIGEDFGFNPIFLRIPLAAMVVVNPLWAIGGYFGLGLAVLASRLLFPKATSQAAGSVGAEPANQHDALAKAA
jgi:phage shock protein C